MRKRIRQHFYRSWDAAPGNRRKCRDALYREIGESGKDRSQVVADGDLQPTAAFHDRENCRCLRSRLRAPDVYPVLSTQLLLNVALASQRTDTVCRVGYTNDSS